MARLSGIEAVERPPTLGRRAYLQIQQAIRDGLITHGELYSENELAESLGMSRTPVREALISLNREGIIVIESQRGFRLRELSEAERQEIFDLRALLEGFTASRLAHSATGEDVSRLRELIDAQEALTATGDQSEFLSLDERFHLLQTQILGLQRTHATMVGLRGAMWLIGYEALSLPRRLEAVVAEHRAIVDAIERGDAEGAAEAARAHLARTAGALKPVE
ncbi:GntR family transcriptional regulator [Actinomadura litoris]|uniref:FCD domain-containing protein n=1 Tax=Actinomadura litoris TaxID=2678616 RepID=A0A7K1L9G2_9ACTN|nr:GntR family transcriptional regulator [Actinomadura litoris]MUN41060.1 FCD domain-containing protein [Actinomadura litoris]